MIDPVLLDHALSLSYEERSELVGLIMDSLDASALKVDGQDEQVESTSSCAAEKTFAQTLIETLRGLCFDPVEPMGELLSAQEVLRSYGEINTESHIPEINEHPILKEEAEAIRDQLIRILHTCHDRSPAVPTIIWALSKLHDKSLEHLFLIHLEKSLRQYRYASHYLGQCIVALEGIVELPQADDCSSSFVLENAKLIRQAELTLKNKGVVVPL